MSTIKIFVWPDNSWTSEEEIDDMDWYLCSTGKSDDYAEYDIPIGLDEEDIDELIQLKALPGMIKPKNLIELDGKVDLPTDSILVLEFPVSEVPYITHLDGKMIINCTEMSIEVLKGK
jgi:hypothetical protein